MPVPGRARSTVMTCMLSGDIAWQGRANTSRLAQTPCTQLGGPGHHQLKRGLEVPLRGLRRRLNWPASNPELGVVAVTCISRVNWTIFLGRPGRLQAGGFLLRYVVSCFMAVLRSIWTLLVHIEKVVVTLSRVSGFQLPSTAKRGILKITCRVIFQAPFCSHAADDRTASQGHYVVLAKDTRLTPNHHSPTNPPSSGYTCTEIPGTPSGIRKAA
jgi:hypothetical protein